MRHHSAPSPLPAQSVFSSERTRVQLGQIELRQLRYVVAVSEDLHFGRAANRLHLAAPSLSKQIRQLERLLGYPLFQRGTRHVELTAMGSAFVEEAREALEHVKLALTLSAGIHRAQSATHVVAYSPWVDPAWIQRSRRALVLDGFHSVVFRSECAADQIQHLFEGRLSGGIMVLPIADARLRVYFVRREQLVLAVSADHALAGHEVIRPCDLAGQAVISTASSEPSLHEQLSALCDRHGHSLSIALEVRSVSEAIELISAGFGIAMVRASWAARFPAQGVIYRQCSATDFSAEVGFVCREDQPPPFVEALVDSLRQQ